MGRSSVTFGGVDKADLKFGAHHEHLVQLPVFESAPERLYDALGILHRRRISDVNAGQREIHFSEAEEGDAFLSHPVELRFQTLAQEILSEKPGLPNEVGVESPTEPPVRRQ